MDRALFGYEPLRVFETICCFLGFNLKFTFSSEVLHIGSLCVCYLGNPLANVSEVVGNPLANLL
jgi:hypothetical protein